MAFILLPFVVSKGYTSRYILWQREAISVLENIAGQNRQGERWEVESQGYFGAFDMHCDDVDTVKLVSEIPKASLGSCGQRAGNSCRHAAIAYASPSIGGCRLCQSVACS